MAFDFPASPTPGQEFNPAGGPTYVWQPPRWVLKGVGVAWGGITGTLSAQTDLQTALNAKASLAGAAFTGDITVPDEAYGVAWNSSVEAPTKNALYDKIQSLPVVPVLTTGGITFGSATGTLGQDTANLFFDDTSNQLMVGGAVTSPSFNLASSAAYFSGTAVYTTVNFDNFDFMQYAKGTDTLVFNVAAAERLRITSAGFVGVGTGNPTAQLTVAAQGTIHATRYGASQPSITFMTAGGTEAAPTPPGIGQGCGAFVWRAYDGVSNYAQLGGVNGFAEAAPTATSSPGFITLATTATGAVSATERMRITSAGRVGIGYTPIANDATLETSGGAAPGSGGGMIRANIGGGTNSAFDPGFIIRNWSQANHTSKSIHLLAQGRTTAGAEVPDVGRLLWYPLDANWAGASFNIDIRHAGVSHTALNLGANGATIGGNAAFQYAGVTVQNKYASASQVGIAYNDYMNELGVLVGYTFCNMNTDGSAVLVLGATPPGARNTDRRTAVATFATNFITFTPQLLALAGVSVSPASVGGIRMEYGSPTDSGYMRFSKTDGASCGYIGYAPQASGGHINYANENGGGHSFAQTCFAPAFTPVSDVRLKENIAPATESPGAIIDAIQIRQFDWKEDGKHQSHGLVAQELFEVYPEAVVVPHEEHTEDAWAYDPARLLMLALKEIQELRARLAAIGA